MDSLEALQNLQKDLSIFNEARLPVLERLTAELEAQLDDFRQLLSTPSKSDESRKKIQSGTIEIDEQTYTINEDFQNASLQLADELNVNEIEAAKLFLSAQDEAQDLERPPLAIAVFRFHRRRQALLECLKIVVRESIKDVDEEETEALAEIRIIFRDFVRRVLGYQSQDADSPSKYWRSCLGAMADIERWQQRLSDHLQRFSVTGQTLTSELSEVIEFQQQSLAAQHESLAAIAAYLVRGNYTVPDDLRFLISKARTVDKYDLILIDYAAVLITAIAHFGQSEEICTLEDARSINDILLSGKESEKWALRNFHAVTVTWWLAEYSGRFQEPSSAPQLRGTPTPEDDGKSRDTQFVTALNDGAFHFALSFAQDVTRNESEDPAKTAFVAFLLTESVLPMREFAPPSQDIRILICAGLQAFTEGFITNMPDTIRTLRSTEDESRKTMRSRFQRGNQDSELHIERFLLIASYAYAKDPSGAMTFLLDPESNLYGFLQWAARRQTTPRVAAFCELMSSLSANESCADAVHRFLLDEGQPFGGRIRRTGSLSWSQILAELQFYASNPREKQSSASGVPQTTPDEYVEPESAMMLECYLRLVSDLCKHSPTGREWLIGHPDIQFQDLVLSLCTNAIESRLRACAFDALTSLCTSKSPATASKLWASLDAWVYDALPSTATMAKPLVRPGESIRHEEMVFKSISTRTVESLAFVNLLHALVSPPDFDTGLNDELPFPENLGATYRMPGIDAYVDFAFGRVFGEKSLEASRVADNRSLALTCLNFAALCLSIFNEDLVVLANRGNVDVEGIIRTSSLSAYARLHPFARVMEWMFNEKVVLALFAAAHQDVDTINNAESDSTLVSSLTVSINVISLVLKLQPTYLDIIRPLVKTQSVSQRTPVGNAALPSFDDAILNNIRLVSDLGLYSGTGHQELVMASLQLLQLISTSRKLNTPLRSGIGSRAERSRIITVLELDDDVERIARGFITEMSLDERELEAGPETPAYIIKKRILEFLISCLVSNRDRPTMAHLLLGFRCQESSLAIADDGLFANGNSLLHAITRLALECPDVEQTSVLYWTSAIKELCLRVLQLLWISPLSSKLVLSELLEIDFEFYLAVQQATVREDTVWDDRNIRDPEFLISDAAATYVNFLKQRSAYLELMSRTLRSIPGEATTSFRQRVESTLLGETRFPGAEPVSNANIFDLFDFMELNFGTGLSSPTSGIIGDIDMGVCQEHREQPYSPINLIGLGDLLLLRQVELRKNGIINSPETEQLAEAESQQLLLFAHGMNQHHEAERSYRVTLKTWVQLVVIALETLQFKSISKTSFSLQALQLILPKLENSFANDVATASELAGLALTLVRHIDLSTKSSEKVPTGDLAKDRSFQLFRLCISSVSSYEFSPDLRSLCYQICYRYLQEGPVHDAKKSAVSHRVLHTVKALGDPLFDVLSDDAVAGQSECRVSALLLLTALVSHANSSGSKYVLQAFNKVNFTGALTDCIKSIPTSLGHAAKAEAPALLAVYSATLSLLLQISDSPAGAAATFNAGLFQSIRESALFSIDPDIGLDMDTENALEKFHGLLLGLLRVVNAVVLARGPQNDQTIKQARDFLRDVRPCVVGVFKRVAMAVDSGKVVSEELTELVDNWTLLITQAGFLEFEDGQASTQANIGLFS